MSDLRHYAVDVERDLQPPALSDLVEVARSRRRARALAVTAASVSVAVIAAVAGWGGLTGTDRSASPAHRGSQPTAPLAPSAWTAEDVVGHPDATVLFTVDAADPAFRLRSVPASDHDGRVTVWFRCSTDVSTAYVSDCAGERASAIEVTGRGGAPLLLKMEDPFLAYSIEYVGSGRFFLNGQPLGGPDMLVGAGMREPLPLSRTTVRATMTPGLDVVLCNDLPPCLLDVASGTLTPIEVPGLDDYQFAVWADDSEIGLWGIAAKDGAPSALVQLDPSTASLRRIPTEGAPPMTLPLGVPAGVMAYFTNEDCCLPAFHNMPILRLLHVSTDRGRTWRVLSVPQGVEGSLDPVRYVTHTPTLPEGWEDWPEVSR